VRYPGFLLYFLLSPLAWTIPFILQALALAPSGYSSAFATLSGTGDVTSFLIIGILVSIFGGAAFFSIGSLYQWEMQNGTLEAILAATPNHAAVLAGAALADALMGSLSTALTFAVTAPIAHFVLGSHTIPYLVTAFLLTVAAMFGLAALIAPIALIVRQMHGLLDVAYHGLECITPARFPIGILPETVRVVAHVIPLTLGVVAIRKLLIADYPGPRTVTTELVLLLLLFLGFWLAAVASNRLCLRWARQRGSLGQY